MAAAVVAGVVSARWKLKSCMLESCDALCVGCRRGYGWDGRMRRRRAEVSVDCWTNETGFLWLAMSCDRASRTMDLEAGQRAAVARC